MKKIIFLFIIFLAFFSKDVFGGDNEYEIKKQLSIYDFGDLEKLAEKNEIEISPQKIAEQTVKGEFEINIDEIINYIIKALFKEVLMQWDLIKTIVGLCVLCGVLKFISNSFSQGSSQLAYYICFMVAITDIMMLFSITSNIVLKTAEDFENIINASIPLLCGSVFAVGGGAGVAVMLPIVAMIAETAIKLTEIFFIPMINICGGLGIVNYFSQKPMLTKLNEFLLQIVSWALKGFSIVALGIMGLYRFGNATSLQTAFKMAKVGAGAIPVVGDILSGSMQTVAVFGSLIKSGIGLAVAILIIVCVFTPFMKILAIVFACKAVATITQPMGERGISECIDTAGNIISMMLGVIIMMIVIFLSMVFIFVSLSGG